MKRSLHIIEHPLFKIIGEAGDELGMNTYVIGGWVRDGLLNRSSNQIEFDIVSDKDGIVLAKHVAKKLKVKKISIYKTFGTAAIVYKGVIMEFNGARKESYSKDSRDPVVTSGSMLDDQKRRDFTINSMSISLNNKDYGAFIDPFNGLEDLENKIIKTPLEPDKTYSDDPLRMMRAIRFASTLDFTIDKQSLDSIKSNKDRLKIIKQERITDELNKIILSKTPSKGINLLSDLDLLNIFFPEFELLRGIENKNGITHKDNFYHTLEVLDNISVNTNNIWLRWSAILHDIAKPNTKRFNDKNGWTFHGHEHLGSKMVYHIFKKLKLPLNENMKYVQKLVLLHLRPIALANSKVTESAIRRLLFDAKNDINDLMLLCDADITSKNEQKVAKYKQNMKNVSIKLKEVEERDKISSWRPPITGDIIMEKLNLKPSREIGIIKQMIQDAILDGDIKNTYLEAEELMYKVAKKIIH
jgi:poly(A) polymerase